MWPFIKVESIWKKPIRANMLIMAVVFLLSVTIVPQIAYATNGYFSHGQGVKYKAIGGAGVALYLGPMAAANNPGAMALAGPGYEIGFYVFNPNREFSVTGEPSTEVTDYGLTPGTYESGSNVFFIPSIAANWWLNEDETATFGIALYGHGGMNTDYDAEVFNPRGIFDGTSPAGIDLMQMFLAPTFSMVFAERHGFGVSPILAWQRFEAKGLNAFGDMGYSDDMEKLTDNGYSNSFGYGVRAGYLGEWLDFMSFGFSVQSEIKMSEFEEYSGLFAEEGDFDIPATWTAGVAFGFTGMGLAFDVQQIFYSSVAAIANPLWPNLNVYDLGEDEGAGFGWEDMTVYKMGAWYLLNSGWMLRGGYSYGSQPVPETELLLNILAPGVIEQHITFGISKAVGIDRELSFVVTRALSKTVSGDHPLQEPGQQTIELKMDQWEFGVGLSF
ncbi:MAG: outer membrane protein transport protein [Bacteroidales bacterium]|nr:outer membrane protein transport protein [Candidatus Latescibacterota bacterium]